MIPQHIAGIRYDRLLQNRLNEMMFEYHDTSGIERLLHGPLKPLVRLFWWVQGHVTRLATGAPPEMVPDHPIPADLERLGIGAPFYRSVRQGRATPRQGEIAAFTGPSSLRLDDGESLEADVVVFATGWEQHLDVLAEELRTSVLRDGRFHLFRHILPPDVPRLGFVGYASSFVNTLTSELAAHWLAEAFRGDLDLPDRSEQERAIASVHSWADAHFSSGAKGDIFIGPHVGHYADELLRDLGLDPYRASNFIAEYFGRLLPHRYAGIGEERRALRQNSA
jgi:hypothetical protein